ncbi:MAG: carboxypeptidase regulatory-like domain-containing protein [Acidobacteria bacterium]|nr:carboxypeptidase regulatory-like domain-containing protein [Acidobacteriota bacterium]
MLKVFLILVIAIGVFSELVFYPISSNKIALFQSGLILQGKVVNENEQPQIGATVSISLDGAVIQTLLTTSDGIFNISLPKLGQYTVSITLDGFRTQTEVIPITREEPFFYLFKLAPSSLHILVLDNYQEKLSDVTVTLKGQDNTLKRAIESPKGNYYFGRLQPGIYQLNVIMPGFEIVTDDSVYISSDNNTILRSIALQRASPIPIGDKIKERYTTPVVATVQSLLQDRISGEVWLGTSQGVVRFNGEQILTAENQNLHLSVLANENIQTIFQDSDATIWFATTKGLRKKFPNSNKIEITTILSGRPISSIVEDKNKNLWFATEKGLMCYSRGVLTEYNTSQGLPADKINSVNIDKTGDIVWVATPKGIAKIEQGKIIPVLDEGKPIDWPTNFIFEDSRNITWFLTDIGLKQLSKGKFLTVEKEELRRPFKLAVEDRVGNLWFSGINDSVYVYDLQRNEVDDQLTSDHILSLLADREGNVWFGTENGVIRQDFYSFVNFNTSRGLPDTNIYSLLPDTNKPGALWVGSSSGLIYFDGVTFSRIIEIPTNLSIYHILQQKTGVLWVATSDGLYRRQNNKWTRLGIEQGLASADVRYLCEDIQDQTLWVATKKGVSHFDSEIAAKVYPAAVAPEPLKITAEVRQIYQQSNRLLWFATDRGVYRYDPVTYDLTVIGQNDALESLDIRWIIEGSNPDILWFATAKGIEIFKEQKVIPSERISGLVEDFRSIFKDRDQMFWLASSDGKVKKCFIPQIKDIPPLITTYTREKHGLVGNEIRAITQDSSGAIWFATEAGLTRHLPSFTIPNVDCKVEVDGVAVTKNELESGQHNIKFRFTSNSSLGDVAFIHRILINGEENPYRLITKQLSNEALFTDLPAGEHIFEVFAINRDLYGATAKPLQVIIKIDLPFWKKKWFYLVIGLSMSFAFAGIIFIRQRQRREYVLPANLKSFVPIEPNPYIVGNPIRTAAMFFGREDDFNYLKTKLEGTAQGGMVLVLCGERRAGKSSILYQVLNGRLGEEFIPVFIDLQEMVIANEHEFFGRIARLIGETISEIDDNSLSSDNSFWTKELKSFQFSDTGKNAYHLFLDFLNEILSSIGEKRLILLIDEYELLETKVEDKKLSKEIFTFFASLIDNHERLSFVFTGSRRLEERDRKYWREFLRRSLFRKVSFLSERDSKRLIVEPVKDKLVFGRGVEDAIYRLTSGQPFYTQYICQAIVDYINESKRNYLLKSDLNEVVEEIIDNPLPQMIYFWDGFGDDEKLVMSLVAEVLKDSNDAVTANRIAQAIQKENYPVKLSTDTIRLTLEELTRVDVLKKISDETFCFRIDLLRLWIKKSHSIWRVVREARTL